MNLFFYQQSDLTYIFIYVFLLFNFFYFFVSYMVDVKQVEQSMLVLWMQKHLFKLVNRTTMAGVTFKGKCVEVQNDTQNKELISFEGVNMSFLLFCMLLNLGVFIAVFYQTGNFCMNYTGAGVFIDVGACFILISLNFFFVMLCFVYYQAFFNKGFMNLKIFFSREELLFIFFLHLVSFVFCFIDNFVSFFLCLEIISFIFYVYVAMYGNVKPVYALVNFVEKTSATEASLKYLIPGLFSSVLFLTGMFLVYLSTGVLGFEDLKLILSYSNIYFFNFLIFVGFLFIFCSFGLKFSVVPFHNWVLWVYSGVVQHIVFFLATVSKYFYFVVFLKNVYFLFLFQDKFELYFLMIAFFSIILGTVYGLFEVRFNMIIAYSGILNFGYIFCAFSLFSFQGVVLSFFFYFIYLFFSFAIYTYLLNTLSLSGSSFLGLISDFKNISFFNVSLYFFLILFFFSIIGMPPLPGFYPKFLLFLNLFFFKQTFICVFFLFFVILSAFFYFSIIVNLTLGLTLFKNFFFLFSYNSYFLNKLFFFIFICLCSSPSFCDLFLFVFEVSLC